MENARRWQDGVEPELRPRMTRQIAETMAGSLKTLNRSQPKNFHKTVANFEMKIFETAKDKMEYMTTISQKMRTCLVNTRAAATASHQQKMHMAHQIQLDNTVQPVQGGNSSFTTIPQAAPMMPFQFSNQHMNSLFASDTQNNVNQGPSDVMAMLCQTFSAQPSMVVEQSVQPGQQIIQSIAMQNNNQHPAMQLQPTNVAQCHPASMAHMQGQPIAGPNGHQRHVLSQNVCMYAQNLQPTAQQQHFGITQQQVDMQRYQMLGDDVAKMNDAYSGGWNNQLKDRWASGIQSPLNPCKESALKRQTDMECQSILPTQSQIAVNQQSNMHCQSQQIQVRMGSDGEVDWREEMIQQIKSLKDAYFLEIVELDQNIAFQRLTEEQCKSLSREEADKYKNKANVKGCITAVLEFLQLQKSLETYKGKLAKFQKAIDFLLICYRKNKATAEKNNGQGSKYCPRQPPPPTINLTADKAQSTNGNSNQQKLPAVESIGQMKQNVVTTPSTCQKTHRNQLQGLTSPCFSIKSPRALQSSPIDDVGLCCTPLPIDTLQVASPNSLLNSRSQSPIATPGIRAAGSPYGSVESVLTSTIEKSVFLAAGSPCASVMSGSPSVIPKSSPADSNSSLLLHEKASVNGCNQTTPTILLTPDSPCQKKTPAGQAEDQEHGRAETPVAKKPIDRLIAAVLSSPPEVLCSTVNLMVSARREMDSVLLFGSDNKMKRASDVKSPSESPTLGSMDGSTMKFESDASDSAYSRYHGVKRLKTQSTKDALLDEIEAVNRRLIDTVISITKEDREDGITSHNGVTLIKLSYTAVSLAPSLKSRFATSGNLQHLVMPMTLLIPADYPRSSPIIMDGEGDAQRRTKFSCISVAVDVAFQLALRNLKEPRSLQEMARAWDSCVRHAIREYVYSLTGGMLSSRLVWSEGWVSINA